MNWRDELINDENQVEAFLRRYLPINESTSEDELDFSVKRHISINTPWLDFHGHSESTGVLVWTGLHANEGHHYSSLAIKCMLAIAASRACNFMLIEMVRHDGKSFWPYHGTLPYSTLAGGLRLKEFRDEYEREMNDEAREEIDFLGFVSERSSLRAWRSLSQCSLHLDDGRGLEKLDSRRYIRNLIFDMNAPDDNHVLLMDDPATMMILEKRVGAIPSKYEGGRRDVYDFTQMLEELKIPDEEIIPTRRSLISVTQPLIVPL